MPSAGSYLIDIKQVFNERSTRPIHEVVEARILPRQDAAGSKLGMVRLWV